MSINKDILENVKNRMRSKMTKDSSGRLGWALLHLSAEKYPHNPTQENREWELRFISTVIHNLTCPMCQQHAKEYVENHHPDLSNRLNLMKWVFDFHNSVNERIGKKVISWGEYMQLIQ